MLVSLSVVTSTPHIDPHFRITDSNSNLCTLAVSCSSHARSHFCVVVPFLTVVQSICQNYCIGTNLLVRFPHLLAVSLVVCQPQTFSGMSFFTGPTVWNSIPCGIQRRVHSTFRQLLKHIFSRVTSYLTKLQLQRHSSSCMIHSHH